MVRSVSDLLTILHERAIASGEDASNIRLGVIRNHSSSNVTLADLDANTNAVAVVPDNVVLFDWHGVEVDDLDYADWFGIVRDDGYRVVTKLYPIDDFEKRVPQTATKLDDSQGARFELRKKLAPARSKVFEGLGRTERDEDSFAEKGDDAATGGDFFREA